METEELRKKFWKKLEEDERSFAWFHRNYLQENDLKYITLYKQARGKEFKHMSDQLIAEIKRYLGD